MDGRARDLLTRPDGTSDGAAEAGAVGHRRRHDPRGRRARAPSPTRPALQDLVGVMVGPGFRGRVDALVPEERDAGDPAVPAARRPARAPALVSGYALHAGAVGTRHDGYLDAAVDQCAGWAGDGGMMTFIRSERQLTRPARARPRRSSSGPTTSWLALSSRGRPARDAAVAGGSMSAARDRRVRPRRVLPRLPCGRRRRGDRRPRVRRAGDRRRGDAARCGRSRPTPTCCRGSSARPRWGAPPALAGHALAELRPWVRKTFTGTSTCTHLNDTLRCLADVDVLIDRLVAAGV